MPIQYTRPMLSALTSDVERRLHESLDQFPELAGRTIRIGLTRSAEGTADAEGMTIRLNVRRRRGVSYFTIGHELTHLLQSGGLGIVPGGEVQCDVWTLARSDLFLDDHPTYLCRHLWSRSNWPAYASSVRAWCVKAIEVRATNRRYLAWLNEKLARCVAGAVGASSVAMSLSKNV